MLDKKGLVRYAVAMWMIWYLNKYMVEYGLFNKESDARKYIGDVPYPKDYKFVYLPIRQTGDTFITAGLVTNIPKQGPR